MTQDLHQLQASAGATFEEIGSATIPVSFGNDSAALEAARTGVVLCDRSHWGRMQISDADRQNFLHNQSTNDIKRLQPGQGCDTVFVTSTARTLDLASVYVTEDTILLLVSPNRCQTLMEFCDRYIFFADRVKLTNLTNTTATFSLLGPQSDALLDKLGASSLIGQPDGNHALFPIGDSEVRVAVGSGLAIPGYTLFVAAEAAASLWQQLVEGGAVPLGDRVWEQLRIQQGRPAPEHELTEDYNPLEAGLWQTISFNKGCYIGQETIARLDTYKGVKQQLWGIRLSEPVAAGSTITLGDDKVGVLTSSTTIAQEVFGLGYIRTKAGGAGLQVQVGTAQGEVVPVPFLTYNRQ
ncbi:folate-binding protein YgfZ [Trichocoleus sp. FACHB-591]|uniref:CAF17-like 4Fe-4S cluster assembly/insertion protein YgfZ n=1 Tax=Trichocoleus sp. FACHB-591 TaxID=2692872 RepID=UPI001687AB20|nr:folate-binding protein YgfZ [Trichocoleus sp. FACHB-591]MBD2096018.1 folate-binding protein YgfZ [Trichocoleus sp. FACHB-591]